MLLTLEGQDWIFNLNTIRNIQVENSNLVIVYTGGKNVTFQCDSATAAKALFENLHEELSRHYPVYHANLMSFFVAEDV